ncbi:MAG: amidohydrolase family protein [Clostridia bacterium]|nr:amidohydrolase family protein [Clostridia bacterium]
MGNLFEVKEVDKIFYDEKLKDFLPNKFIDIHTHVWLDGFRSQDEDVLSRAVTWPSRVAQDNSIEDLIETYKLMFPDKEVTPMIFSTTPERKREREANDYIKECAEKYNFPSLIFALPEWTGQQLEQRVIEGGFYGCKVYLTLSPDYIPEKEIRIFDFLPHHQLEVIDKHGWIVVLHIPRDGRLKDPVNLAQMLEIEDRYPNVKLIIAHVGRAYCAEDVGNAFEVLSDTKNMMFDFCANTNQWVFEQLIKAVGPKRIMFGSDLPILRMRTKRICESGKYINLVPKGLYGDVSDDSHMREVEGEQADKLTFFMYEEIDAFRRAAQTTGLSDADIEDIFYNNARGILEKVGHSFK